MNLVQITERSGRVNRVPLGEFPCVELELSSNQQIVKFEIHELNPFDSSRVTQDWRWRAWVETRL